MSRISDLLLRQGDIEAQRAQNSGAFWGGLASEVANIPRSINEIKTAQLKVRQAAEDRQYKNAYMSAQTGHLRSQAASQDADTAGKVDERTLAAQTRKVGDWLTSIAGQSDPEQKKATYASGRAALLADGTMDTTDAPDFYPGDSWVKARFTQLLPAKERFSALFPEPDKPVVVGPGSSLRDVRTGAQLGASQPFKEEPVTYGQPFDGTVNGRGVKLRSGSDGKTYDMQGNVVPDAVAPYQAPSQAQPEMKLLTSPTGEQKYVPVGQANALLASGWRAESSRPPTQGQYAAGGYAGRMAQGSAILEKLQTKIADMGMLSQLFNEGINDTMFARLQGDDYKSYAQAARNFINATLRRESGAAISPTEFASARAQYLPGPGDPPELLAQKKRNRDYAQQTFQREAGDTYVPPLGDVVSVKVIDINDRGQFKLSRKVLIGK